jgi:hypothetical protein
MFANWDKDNYTERFPALLPCTSVLEPKLLHLYLNSSLLPGHLPIVTSVILQAVATYKTPEDSKQSGWVIGTICVWQLWPEWGTVTAYQNYIVWSNFPKATKTGGEYRILSRLKPHHMSIIFWLTLFEFFSNFNCIFPDWSITSMLTLA